MEDICSKCGQPIKMRVKVYLDIPVGKCGKISKLLMRSPKANILGADWKTATIHCGCGLRKEGQLNEL